MTAVWFPTTETLCALGIDEKLTLLGINEETITDFETPEVIFIREEQRKILKRLMEGLDKRSRYVIYRRIINEKTLKEIGVELCVSRERVRQIEAHAITHIRRETFDYYPRGLDGPEFSIERAQQFSDKIALEREEKLEKDFIKWMEKRPNRGVYVTPLERVAMPVQERRRLKHIQDQPDKHRHPAFLPRNKPKTEPKTDRYWPKLPAIFYDENEVSIFKRTPNQSFVDVVRKALDLYNGLGSHYRRKAGRNRLKQGLGRERLGTVTDGEFIPYSPGLFRCKIQTRSRSYLNSQTMPYVILNDPPPSETMLNSALHLLAWYEEAQDLDGVFINNGLQNFRIW